MLWAHPLIKTLVQIRRLSLIQRRIALALGFDSVEPSLRMGCLLIRNPYRSPV